MVPAGVAVVAVAAFVNAANGLKKAGAAVSVVAAVVAGAVLSVEAAEVVAVLAALSDIFEEECREGC